MTVRIADSLSILDWHGSLQSFILLESSASIDDLCWKVPQLGTPDSRWTTLVHTVVVVGCTVRRIFSQTITARVAFALLFRVTYDANELQSPHDLPSPAFAMTSLSNSIDISHRTNFPLWQRRYLPGKTNLLGLSHRPATSRAFHTHLILASPTLILFSTTVLSVKGSKAC